MKYAVWLSLMWLGYFLLGMVFKDGSSDTAMICMQVWLGVGLIMHEMEGR